MGGKGFVKAPNTRTLISATIACQEGVSHADLRTIPGPDERLDLKSSSTSEMATDQDT